MNCWLSPLANLFTPSTLTKVAAVLVTVIVASALTSSSPSPLTKVHVSFVEPIFKPLTTAFAPVDVILAILLSSSAHVNSAPASSGAKTAVKAISLPKIR